MTSGEDVSGVVIQLSAPPHRSQPITTPAQVTLPVGYFRFTVIGVPDGYRLEDPDGVYEGTIERGRDQERQIRAVANPTEPVLGTLGLTKRDRITGEPLRGAIFRVVTCSGNYAVTMTSNAQGVAYRDLAPGCYDLLEDAAPAGYQLDLTPHRVWIKRDTETDSTVYDIPVDYVAPRDPEARVPLSSVPSGRTS
ncbi:MSCRAMM family protein [Gordonia neofelifaecis]|uniref:Lpxtg-motif cell wall anchor domain protein n=1 Tax=Gordonia neofelifaecis NRRL B-59395 TaxID=644548 RepID=F1YGB7_9ACTN|nr:SpaA isopeptide-forming pilin-related protein [Gordonia neofelifaecis]EGD56136.1 lpxtg-motif cell wall anchor domain protein [Gordonia neofelifaecis NRRL B-59395]